MILLCLFAPKLYIILFNPSKNIHVKFKTAISSPHTSVEQPSASNIPDEFSSSVTNHRRHRHPSSDYATELSLFNSKSDSWALTLSDEITQTGTNDTSSVHIDQACTDAERQRYQTQMFDEENIDLLSSSKSLASNHHASSSSSLKPTTSNLAITSENPWKKLSSVRYKLDDQKNYRQDSKSNQQIHAQHITFV